MQSQRKKSILLHSLLALFLASAAALWLHRPAQAATIQVDGSDCTLPEAITAANDDDVGTTGCVFDGAAGDELLVLTPGATYVLDSLVALNTGTPSVVSTITISGSNTIVTRDTSFTCDDDLFRLFHVGINGNLTLHGLTLQNGCVSDHGGAIYVTGGKLTLSDSVVQFNHATGTGNDGGAIYVQTDTGIPGSVTLQGSTIYSNTAADAGGAISFNSNSSAYLENTSIISNTATDAGGLYIKSNIPASILDSVLQGNVASSSGGALLNANDSRSVITNTRFLTNTASSMGGGVMNNLNAQLSLDKVYFEGNRSGNGGGAIFNQSSATVVATDTDIINSKGAIGAGIFNNRGTVTLTGSRLEGGVSTGNGGGIFNNGSRVTLTDSYVVANQAGAAGGGLFNNSAGAQGVMIITGSYVLSNTAVGNGGGINGNSTSLLTIIDTEIISNSTAAKGGGLYMQNSSTANITNTTFISNSTAANGGGLYMQNSSTANITNTTFISNTATAGGTIYRTGPSNLSLRNSLVKAGRAELDGGGIYNDSQGSLTISGSQINANLANANGGGLYNNGGTVTITNTDVLTNVGVQWGGGLFNNNFETNVGKIVFSGGSILSNESERGGGIVNNGGEFDLEDTEISHNQATTLGGGAYNSDGGRLAITNTQILLNQAGSNVGGALADEEAISSIYQSCIVGNSPVAVHANNSITPIAATQNWWGTLDGPSGFGPGNGDEISDNVDFSGFLTSPILDCPTFSAALAVTKEVEPAGDLLPGQPLTYTITISNNGARSAYNISLAEFLPAEVEVTEVVTNGLDYDTVSHTGELLPLAANQSTTLQLIGRAPITPSANQSITNSVVISHVLIPATITATASNQMILPTVVWSAEKYTTTESSGPFTATLLVQPSKPYVTVTLQITVDGVPQEIAIAPGNASWPVVLPVADNHTVGDDVSVALAITGAENAIVGTPASATLTIQDDDVAGLQIEPQPLTIQSFDGSGTLTVTLTSAPTGTVAVNFAPGSAFCTVTPNPLTLDGASWNAGLTVTVAATNTLPNSGIVECDLAVTLSSDDPAYHQQFTQTVDVDILTGDLVISTVLWSSEHYTLTEGSSETVADLVILPPNPHTTITVQIGIEQVTTTQSLALGTDAVQAAAVQEVVVPPGNSAWPVTIANLDDEIDTGNRTFALTILDAVNAQVDDTNMALLTLIEDDTVGDSDDETMELAVSLQASHTQARVGETIIYTYRITNTGKVALTNLSAVDDRLGPVTDLAQTLAVGESSSDTLSYIVQPSDLPGPLVNVVTVTAQNANNSTEPDDTLSVDATVSVALLDVDEPAQGSSYYLPSIHR